MAFSRTSVINRATSDVLAIERIVDARHKSAELQMAEILKIAEDYKRNLEFAGFGFLLDPDKVS